MDEEFTRCSICLEDYNKTNRIPKQLPCQHAFCSPCLAQVFGADRNNVNCPTCRQKFKIKCDDVPKSRLILNFLDMMGHNNNNNNSGGGGSISTPAVTSSYPSQTSSNQASSSLIHNAHQSGSTPYPAYNANPHPEDTQRNFQPTPAASSIPTYVDYSMNEPNCNPYESYPRQTEQTYAAYSDPPQANQ